MIDCPKFFLRKHFIDQPDFKSSVSVKNYDTSTKHHAVIWVMRGHDNGKSLTPQECVMFLFIYSGIRVFNQQSPKRRKLPQICDSLHDPA